MVGGRGVGWMGVWASLGSGSCWRPFGSFLAHGDMVAGRVGLVRLCGGYLDGGLVGDRICALAALGDGHGDPSSRGRVAGLVEFGFAVVGGFGEFLLAGEDFRIGFGGDFGVFVEGGFEGGVDVAGGAGEG